MEVFVKDGLFGAILLRRRVPLERTFVDGLPLFPEDKIVSTFEELERHIDPADMETCAVYRHFRTVWLCAFPPSLWCQHDHLFRTNNFAESFHASLSRRVTQHNPQFPVFARHVVRLVRESRLELDEERFNPKQRWRMAAVRRKVNTLIGNYLNGPPLALALPDLVKAIFNSFHEKVAFEDAFEPEPERDELDSSEVAMEMADD